MLKMTEAMQSFISRWLEPNPTEWLQDLNVYHQRCSKHKQGTVAKTFAFAPVAGAKPTQNPTHAVKLIMGRDLHLWGPRWKNMLCE